MFWHIDTDITAILVTSALYVYTLGVKPPGKKTRQDSAFMHCLLIGIIVMAADIASSLAMDVASSRLVYHLLMTMYLIAQDIVIVSWFRYSITILCHDDEKKRRMLSRIVTYPYLAYVLLAISNPWTGAFYTLSENMVYTRSPYFILLTVGVFTLYSIALIATIVVLRKHIPKGYPTVVLIAQPLILGLSIFVQLMIPGWLLIMPAYMICLVLAFLFFQDVRVQNDEARLRRLTKLVENFACGIAISNIAPDGTSEMYYVSSNLCDIFDDSGSGIIERYNRDVLSYVHIDDRVAVSRVLSKVSGSASDSEVDFRIVTDAGKLKWINAKLRPARQDDGTLTVYTTYTDITEQTALRRQLSDFIKNVPSGICVYIYDGDDLRPITANEKLSELLGEDAMEYLSKVDHFNYSHVHPDDLEKLKRETVLALTDTHVLDTVYRSLNYSTGKYLWIHMLGKMLPQDDGTELVLVSYNDVTQEHETELELLAKFELERKRVALGEENMIVHAIFDLTTGETLEYFYRDGREVPEEERTTFAYGRTNANLLIDDDERKAFLELNDRENLLDRFSKGESEFRLEYRKRMPDGRVIWIRSVMHLVRDPSENGVLLFVYWYDVDEEKTHELMYRSIASDNYDFIARIDGRTHAFTAFPQNGRSGYMPPPSGDDADLVTRGFYVESAIPEDRDLLINNSLVENIKKNLASTGRFSFTYREQNDDGSLNYKKMTQYYIDRKREMIMVLREDITEIIQTETEKNALLSTALAAANQASEAKSQFLSRVSHELRTPLNAIIGFLGLAKTASPEEKESCLAHSDVAAKQLLSLINDILDVSSTESGKLKLVHAPFDLRQMIDSVSTICRAECEGKCLLYETRFETRIDEWLMGDRHRVEQILMNLLGNAIKFTSNGFVRLSISSRSASSEKLFVRFEISDSGCGMSRTMKERLFRPFEQESAVSAQKYGGNGLGLYIVSSLVSLMGGSIKVESVQGRGSIFTVDLPFVKSSAEIDLPNIKDVGTLNVLIVDNEATEREYMAAVLGRIGVKNHGEANGNDAIEELERAFRRGDPYNLCLVDWRMPDMDGIETTRRIREKYGDGIVLIVVSAFDHYQAGESARAAGANLYITKPLMQSSLFDLFSAMIGDDFSKRANDGDQVDLSGKRVLIAEDNDMNCLVLESIVENFGLVSETASDGRIALDMFEASTPGYYDAILMDIQMPNMDGLESTKRIRASAHPDAVSIPIIAVTANAFNEDVAKSLSSGMNAHVSKPIDTKLLASALERAFSERAK